MPRLHLHILVDDIGRDGLGTGNDAIDAILPQGALYEPSLIDEFLGDDMLVIILLGALGRVGELRELDIVEEHHEQSVPLVEQPEVLELPL